jgi:nucleotide-binding universal stress UspA family protein
MYPAPRDSLVTGEKYPYYRKIVRILAAMLGEHPRSKNMFKRIVVPLDGSSRAEVVLPVAAHLAGASGGSLILLQVVNPPVEYGISLTRPPALTKHDIAARFAQATHYLARLAQSEDLEGFGVQTAVLSGVVAATLFSYARSCQADLIVLCSHGYTGFTRWVFGSLAGRVIRDTPVPTLVLQDGGPLPIASRAATGRPLQGLVTLDGSAHAEMALTPVAHLVAAWLLLHKGPCTC